MKIKEVNRIVISRTDSIGDVVLTLPMCQAIKEHYPESHLMFLAADYTIPVIRNCPYIDEHVSWTSISQEPTTNQLEAFRNLQADVFIHVFPRKEISDLAKKVKIKHRIGTSHRSFHLLTCNHRVNFTRKRSNLHESQLNFHLLQPLGIDIPKFERLSAGKYLASNGSNSQFAKGVILHPKSKGSAMEWPLEKYVELAELLKSETKVYVSGTEEEGSFFKTAFKWDDSLIDLSGQFTLSEFQSFVGNQKALIACSTGPLHFAGALGVPAIGIYTQKKPMHPGRWRPLGENSVTVTLQDNCPCKKSCTCVDSISVSKVHKTVLSYL